MLMRGACRVTRHAVLCAIGKPPPVRAYFFIYLPSARDAHRCVVITKLDALSHDVAVLVVQSDAFMLRPALLQSTVALDFRAAMSRFDHLCSNDQSVVPNHEMCKPKREHWCIMHVTHIGHVRECLQKFLRF